MFPKKNLIIVSTTTRIKRIACLSVPLTLAWAYDQLKRPFHTHQTCNKKIPYAREQKPEKEEGNYIVWKDSWRKEWWMYVARLFLYYFYSCIISMCGWMLVRCSVCCWTMAIRRSLFDYSNKLFVVLFRSVYVFVCTRLYYYLLQMWAYVSNAIV